MRPIDADALKEKIDNMWNGRPLSSLGARILVMIDDAPSIDIEPKRGEWKNYKDEHYCTNCREVVIGDWYDEDDWYDFCPNCGARMDGERRE